MKRKLFIFILLGMLSLIKVQGANEPDPRINLLDMTNIMLTDAKIPNHGYGLLVNTQEPITIKPHTDYTLVIDERFYEWDLWQETFHDWEMNNGDISIQPTHYVNQTFGNWVYGTFQSTEAQLMLDGVIVHSYLKDDAAYPFKMMLFEGTMDAFQGYYGYGSVFEHRQGHVLLDVDNQLDVDAVKNLVSVNESSHFTILESTYEPNSPKGVYHILYETYDDALNYAYYHLHVHVMDITPPVVSGKQFYSVEALHTSLTESEVRAALSAEDNVDGIIDNSTFVMTEDTFSSNRDTPGSYRITYAVSDSSDNVTTYSININVFDGRGPVFEGPSIMYRNIKDGLVSISEIMNLLQATDAIEGSTPIILKENNQDLTPGKKTVVFESKDSANNLTTFTFIVVLVDHNAPLFEESPLIISYELLSTMSQEDIVAWILEHIPSATNINIIHDESLYHNQGNLHFSYELDGVTHYQVIAYGPKPNYVVPIIIVSVVVLNLLFLSIYFRRKKY